VFNEDPFEIPRHMGYSGKWVPRTRGGRKSSSGLDYRIKKDTSER